MEEWISALFGRRPNAGEAADLIRRSRGYPLYLRFYASASAESNVSLQALELQALRELSARAQEVLFYLALAGRPLSLGTLSALLGFDAPDAEAAVGYVEEGAAFLRQGAGKVGIIHEHSEQTIVAHLQASPIRLGYFGAELASYFEEHGDYVAAFRVFDLAQERRQADRVVDRAAQQAAARGGGDEAPSIFLRRAEIAHEDGRTEDEVRSLLALAHMLAARGMREEAVEVFNRAEAASDGYEQAVREVRETSVLLDFDRVGHEERLSKLRAIRQEYLDGGMDFEAARISTLLTAEHINAQEFEAARDVARSVLEYFESVGDEYGRRVSLTNLTAALIGLNESDPEALQLARELDETTDPDDSPRERAVICNLLTRRYRESGDYRLAAEYAQEAIRIGEELHNQHVIAINRVNLGNVRRDEGRLDDSLSEYELADRIANAAGLSGDEAHASELIASVLIEKGEYATALARAEHASGLARAMGDKRGLANALEERALALAFLNREEEAIEAFVEAIDALANADRGEGQIQSLLEDGLSLCEARRLPRLKVRFLREALRLKGGGDDEEALGLVEVLQESLPKIVRRMGQERSQAILALAVSEILTSAPTPIKGRVLHLCTAALLDTKEELDPDSVLSGIAGLLMASSWEGLTLDDLADLGDRISARVPEVSFKPQQDGAGHWTLGVRLGGSAVVSVHQLDDSPRAAVITLILACLLRSLDGPLTEQVIQTEHPPRREAQVWISLRQGFEANVGPEVAKLGEMPAGFSVTRSTDITTQEQPPTLAICSDDFGQPWVPTRERLSDVQVLFGELIRTLTMHLLASEIEAEVLNPKIFSFLKRIGYRGRGWTPSPKA